MVIKIIEESGYLDEDVLARAMIELRNTPGPFGVSPATIVFFQPWMLLKDIGKYFLQKNLRRRQHSSHLGGGINIFVHRWDLVQLETTIIIWMLKWMV